MVHIYFSHPVYKGRYVKKVLGITLLISIVATCIAAAGEPPPPTTIEELNAALEEVRADTRITASSPR